MINIRTYFNRLYDEARTEAEWEAVMEYETAIFYDVDDDFEQWAVEHDIDLTAVDENTGETYLQLWAWDMDED